MPARKKAPEPPSSRPSGAELEAALEAYCAAEAIYRSAHVDLMTAREQLADVLHRAGLPHVVW